MESDVCWSWTLTFLISQDVALWKPCCSWLVGQAVVPWSFWFDSSFTSMWIRKSTFPEQLQAAGNRIPPCLTSSVKWPSPWRELLFLERCGAFFYASLLAPRRWVPRHFLWVGSPLLCPSPSWQSPNSTGATWYLGGFSLPPRWRLDAGIKLRPNLIQSLLSLALHFALWLPWSSTGGGQFLLLGGNALWEPVSCQAFRGVSWCKGGVLLCASQWTKHPKGVNCGFME